MFDKWSQAVASAYDLIVDSTTDAERHGQPFFYTISIPALVVSDGTLWTVDYDENGKQVSEPKQTDGCEFFIGKEYPVTAALSRIVCTMSHLHIFTLTGFTGYLSRLAVNERYRELLFSDAGIVRALGIKQQKLTRVLSVEEKNRAAPRWKIRWQATLASVGSLPA